ncbi:2'-5' RNA ligase [Amycolatopsis arida]|uniref:RNA 2',3'-cyclic phosphodiesterase n=1 Tax=Amycolatopsis arida TaxID=587909 RepID=A0A1I5VE50_9PSEU|nr:2'-5' RNA ligase family protein [Amycolatopsis arida]TDX91247.1 2'-5' RNA ligase [Amycolatopsis arida]SFQ05760.1 2'-5' RNA ligase [Amycolatopsis arida]
MRLFSAVVPPAEAVRSLQAALAVAPRGAGLRWVPSGQWHITLGFYGEDDLVARVAWLRRRLAGLPAPALRLTGAGTFPGVLWVGVDGQLTALAAAAGATVDDPTGPASAAGTTDGTTGGAAGAATEDLPFHPHLTLARGRVRSERRRWVDLLAGYAGPRWTATEVVLLSSELGPGGPHYTPVERFALAAGAAG